MVQGAPVLMVGSDEGEVERELVAGGLACPACGGMLRPWGFARWRVQRGGGGVQLRRRPRRSICAALIDVHFASWAQRGPAPISDWLFAPSPMRDRFVTADALSHKFRRLGIAAGVERPALHRLRHGVATHLVNEGKVLKARPVSATATRQPRCATTPTPSRSMMRTSPTTSTPS